MPAALLAWNCVGVEISAGEDDADAQFVSFDLVVQGGGGGDGAGRLDGAAQVLGDQMYGVNHFVFGDQ